MKASILALTLALSFNASAGDFKCILEDSVYKNSPVATVSEVDGKSILVITKSPSDWKVIYKATVKDNTDDVLALFEGKGVSLSYYMDESDDMGMAEGSIKSPVMNGDVRCAYIR